MAEEATQAPESKKLSLKALIIMIVVFGLEAGGVSAVWFYAGAPADVEATDGDAIEADRADQSVEELVIAQKFQNSKLGPTYVYDAEIYITVKRKHQDQVVSGLKTIEAQISMDIATLIRSAQPNELMEPTLATLTRRIKTVLDDRLGKDDQGESMIGAVIIRKFNRFKADL